MSAVLPLPFPCLCLVTDRNLCPPGTLEERVQAAVAGGVDIVQLREKDLRAAELLDMAQQLRAITGGKALFVVNDSLEVAVAAGADGVHLPEASFSVGDAKRLVPSGFLVGKSVHGLPAATRASEEGADYLVLGTIFPTGSKPGADTGGVAHVANVASQVAARVLAIGGIDSRNAASVIEAGARGVAVVSAILGAEDPEWAASKLKRAMLSAIESGPVQSVRS